MQGCKNICLQGVPTKTRSLLTKSKGKEMSGGEAKKDIHFSEANTGKTAVSKLLKILLDLYKENMGQSQWVHAVGQ